MKALKALFTWTWFFLSALFFFAACSEEWSEIYQAHRGITAV